eukprot:6491523-Amphidinium_carterae.2
MLLKKHVPAAYTRQAHKAQDSAATASHKLAKTRPKAQLGTEKAAGKYTSIQLNKVLELMVHQDCFNMGCNWVISVEKYTRGRIWVED